MEHLSGRRERATLISLIPFLYSRIQVQHELLHMLPEELLHFIPFHRLSLEIGRLRVSIGIDKVDQRLSDMNRGDPFRAKALYHVLGNAMKRLFPEYEVEVHEVPFQAALGDSDYFHGRYVEDTGDRDTVQDQRFFQERMIESKKGNLDAVHLGIQRAIPFGGNPEGEAGFPDFGNGGIDAEILVCEEI